MRTGFYHSKVKLIGCSVICELKHNATASFHLQRITGKGGGNTANHLSGLLNY